MDEYSNDIITIKQFRYEFHSILTVPLTYYYSDDYK